MKEGRAGWESAQLGQTPGDELVASSARAMTFASDGFENSPLTVHLTRDEELVERVPVCTGGYGEVGSPARPGRVLGRVLQGWLRAVGWCWNSGVAGQSGAWGLSMCGQSREVQRPVKRGCTVDMG